MSPDNDAPLVIGHTVRWGHRVTADDIHAFAEVSGDTNPVHLDADYAARTRFGSAVAHGILTVAYVSKVIGTLLVGAGHTAIYLEQHARFLKPVRVGDDVDVAVTVLEYDPVKRRARLETTASVDGAPAMTGHATVLIDPYPYPRPAATG